MSDLEIIDAGAIEQKVILCQLPLQPMLLNFEFLIPLCVWLWGGCDMANCMCMHK